MKKRELTIEQRLKKLKRKFYLLLSFFLLFAALTSVYVYMSYDYLAFKHLITENYIYTGTLDSIFKKDLNMDVKGRYFSNFDDLVISVVTGRIRQEAGDRYTYLYTPENLIKSVQSEKQEALQSEIKVLNNSTVYLRLTNFSTYTQKFMEDNTVKLKGYPNIIIDLRDNYGGDIDAMVAMSSMFLPKKSIVATDKLRLFSIVYKAKKEKLLDYKKIIILQNKNTASASENMIAALKDNLNYVELIGEKTFGKGIGQFTMPLKRGFAVKATILMWYTPKGVNIQGNGIDPDIAYTGTDMLQFALDRMAGSK